jgi:endonuclease YncB( thermonuclease family)
VADGRPFRGGLAVLVALGVATVAWAQKPAAKTAQPVPTPTGERSAPARDFSGAPSYKVLRIVDGTSFVVNFDTQPLTVKLIGVENPQAVSSQPKDVRDRLEKQSLQHTTDLLQGKAVYLEQEQGQPPLDSAGRTLVYAYRAPDGLFVNQDLIAKGQGRVSPRRTFRLFDTFRSEEQKARAAKVGLWADSADSSAAKSKDEDEKDAGPESLVVVRGSKKYHRQSCRLAAKGAKPVTAAEVKDKKLEPCQVCKPEQATAEKSNGAKTAQKPKKRRYQSQADQRKMLDDAFSTIPPPGTSPGAGVPVSPY